MSDPRQKLALGDLQSEVHQTSNNMTDDGGGPNNKSNSVASLSGPTKELSLSTSSSLTSKAVAATKAGLTVHKITASAAELSKGLFNAPATHGLSFSSEAGQLSSRKGQPLVRSGESSRCAQDSSLSYGGLSSQTNTTNNAHVFRSPVENELPEQQISEFMSQTRSPLYSREGTLQAPVSVAKSNEMSTQNDRPQILNDADPPTNPERSSSGNSAPNIDLADGAQVVALLSNPEFSVEISPPSSFPIAEDESVFTDLFQPRTTPLEKETIRALRANLPAPPMHKTPSASNPLNLVPGVFWATPDWDKENSAIYSESDAPRDMKFSDWEGVLNRYTDEVWGDLLPLVIESRASFNKALKEGTSLEPETVRRLDLLLGHLRSRHPF